MIVGAATRAITIQKPEQYQGNLTVPQANSTEPLRECVRGALRYFLHNMDGHEVTDLHEMVMGEVERPLIATLLNYTQGNLTQAARMLGLSRSTLRKKMAHYGIRRES